MTESDAKTKWCPFARVAEPWRWADNNATPTPVAGVNRGSDALTGDSPNTLCIGSACMAWRWRESAAFTQRAEETYRRTGARVKNDEGYCGAFGSQQ